jgi:DNA-binding IclR family transcriptional regulator
LSDPKVQSLDRAFDILEILAREAGGLSLAEISRKAVLPKSTAFRLLAVLQGREFVRKSENGALYRLGPGFVELSSVYLNTLELKTEAEPVMRELAASLGTIVFLARRQDDMIVYIDRHDRFPSMRKYAIIGQRKPVYCTALGKALVLDMEEEELRRLLGRTPFIAFGPHTHPDMEAFLSDLAESRLRGWARDDEEAEPGTNCVAAPVRDYRGRIVCAISTSWSLDIRPDLVPGKIAEHVVKAAESISKSMGWAGSVEL